MSRKSFRERNPAVLGLVGFVVIAALLVTALNASSLIASFTARSYGAVFSEAGGLQTGDEVRVAGVQVGKVRSIALTNATVHIGFTVDRSVTLHDASRAEIKTDNPLGKKYLQLSTEGTEALADGAQIPLSRTNSPYDVQQALADLTTTTGQIDTRQLAQALNAVSDTFSGTPDDLGGALHGLQDLSRTISSRDQGLRDLFARADQLTGILAERKDQVAAVLSDGNLLMTELRQRADAIHTLLVTVRQATDQLRGLVADNDKTLKPALDRLNVVLDVLSRNEDNIAKAIQRVGPYARALGESVGSGPFYMGYIANLIAPTNLAPILPQVLEGASVK